MTVFGVWCEAVEEMTTVGYEAVLIEVPVGVVEEMMTTVAFGQVQFVTGWVRGNAVVIQIMFVAEGSLELKY